MLVWPYHIWAWVLDHERSLCASIIKSLYALIIPLVSELSLLDLQVCLTDPLFQRKCFKQFFPQGGFPPSLSSPNHVTSFYRLAVLVLRAWAFTERSPLVLFPLMGTLCSFIAMQFWALTTDLTPSTEIYEVLGKSGCIRSHSYLSGVASERMAVSLVFEPLRMWTLTHTIGETIYAHSI